MVKQTKNALNPVYLESDILALLKVVELVREKTHPKLYVTGYRPIIDTKNEEFRISFADFEKVPASKRFSGKYVFNAFGIVRLSCPEPSVSCRVFADYMAFVTYMMGKQGMLNDLPRTLTKSVYGEVIKKLVSLSCEEFECLNDQLGSHFKALIKERATR